LDSNAPLSSNVNSSNGEPRRWEENEFIHSVETFIQYMNNKRAVNPSLEASIRAALPQVKKEFSIKARFLAAEFILMVSSALLLGLESEEEFNKVQKSQVSIGLSNIP
jgi:hypothetical protein